MWLTELWQSVDKLMPLPADVQAIPAAALFPPAYLVSIDELKDQKESTVASSSSSSYPVTDSLPHFKPFKDGKLLYTPFPAQLKTNRRLTAADHFQDVRHLEFDLTGSSLT